MVQPRKMAEKEVSNVRPTSAVLSSQAVKRRILHSLYYQNGRQRWKSTRATTKPEALKALTKFRELFEERLQSMSFEQFVSQFLTFIETNLAEKSVRLYRTIFKTFVPFVRGACVNEVTSETIDRYKTKRLKEISPVSVNIEMRMLKAAFTTAKRWKLTASNPFDGVAFAKVLERAPLALRVEDFQKLLSCIREDWFKELVTFAVLTGLRRGELLNLQWRDVDLSKKVMTLQTSETFRTKHGRSRTVPLSDLALQILSARVGKSGSKFVFTHNDRQVNDGWVSHLFKRYVRLASLSNPRYRFHSLRHTCASFLLQARVPLAEIQRVLGHTSIKTTEGYAFLPTDNLYDAVNKISLPVN